MARPARAGLSTTALSSSRPGRSAYARWLTERSAHRRRQALSGCAALAALVLALGAVAALAGPWAWLAVVLAGAAAGPGLAALALWPRQAPERWRRGAEGEVATAELLAVLNARRWAVGHDLAVPGSRANIDHLVIGPTGVWVVDTKAFRAPVRARRGRLWAGNEEVHVEVVRWEAEVVAGVLGQRVRAVIAVHGRGLPPRGRLCQGVRALPADALVRRLRRGARLRPRLSRRRVKELAERAGSALSARTGAGGHRDRRGPGQVVSK